MSATASGATDASTGRRSHEPLVTAGGTLAAQSRSTTLRSGSDARAATTGSPAQAGIALPASGPTTLHPGAAMAAIDSFYDDESLPIQALAARTSISAVASTPATGPTSTIDSIPPTQPLKGASSTGAYVLKS